MTKTAEKPQLTAPPASYQEWLECFELLRQRPQNGELLRLMARGSVPALDARLLDSFLKRLDDAVRDTVQYRIQEMLSHLDEALAEADLDGAELLAIRFWNRAGDCFFFERLEGLPLRQRLELRKGYDRQLTRFWSDLADMVLRDAAEFGSSELEELALRFRSLQKKWEHRQVPL